MAGEVDLTQPRFELVWSLTLSSVTATDGGSTEETLELVERGLDGGRLLEDTGSDSGAVALAVNVLVFVDEFDRAERLADEMLADARRRGLVMGFIAGSAHRGLVALRRGALAAAEAETRAALELAQQHGLAFAIPFSNGWRLSFGPPERDRRSSRCARRAMSQAYEGETRFRPQRGFLSPPWRVRVLENSRYRR